MAFGGSLSPCDDDEMGLSLRHRRSAHEQPIDALVPKTRRQAKLHQQKQAGSSLVSASKAVTVQGRAKDALRKVQKPATKPKGLFAYFQPQFKVDRKASPDGHKMRK